MAIAPAVLLFAPEDDRHADAVQRVLSARGVVSARVDLSCVTQPIAIEPGVHVTVGQMIVEPETAIWWRRSGVVPTVSALSDDENRLRAEECEALLVGGLLAVTDRWVDDPFVVMAAEHSLKQLAVARQLGQKIPSSLATNNPAAAMTFHSAAPSRVIAKATSAGFGIAPYADVVGPATFDLLPACITLLQHEHKAFADVRVAVAGERVMTWIRPRDPGEPLDWRAADPQGAGFRRHDSPQFEMKAIELNAALGLRFSVQDWLLVDSEPVFLEVNPSGQWLFLPHARDSVPGALADLLTTGRA